MSAPNLAEGSNLPGLSTRALTRIGLGLLALGLTWRAVRYLLQFPIWGDEAMVAINFARLDYYELTQRLDYCQVAPILFLWAQRAAYTGLGAGELALRLLPFLAGTAALALFWRLTGMVLAPLARTFAVGFLAVAIWPVSMCAVVKPYSWDLLAAVALLLAAVRWLRTPERVGGLVWLTAVGPVAMLASYPAVFVAGGVSLATLPQAWRQGWRARGWFAAYNVAVLAGFGLAYAVGKNHLATPLWGTDTRAGMDQYWADGFPPASPVGFVVWFVLRTTGQMAAYPMGSADGGSTLTVLFALVGVAAWVRQRRWADLTLLLAPLALNVVAAGLHRYPYGTSGRVSQHLAPAICILAGLGLATVIERVRLPARRTKWAVATAGLFAAVGVGGMVIDVVRPYRGPDVVWMRDAMADVRGRVGPDRVVICGWIEDVFAWYWTAEGDRVAWDGVPPHAADGRVWGFHFAFGRDIEPQADAACARLGEALNRQAPGWRLTDRVPYTYEPRARKERPRRCELFCFERTDGLARGN